MFCSKTSFNCWKVISISTQDSVTGRGKSDQNAAGQRTLVGTHDKLLSWKWFFNDELH